MSKVLIQNGSIHIEDVTGVTVFLQDFTDAPKYLGIDIASYSEGQTVTYEVPREINTWFDGIDTVDRPFPDATFDILIANVLTYVDRLNDPYHGMNALLEQAARLKSAKMQLTFNTPTVIANYTHIPNGKDYNLSADVLSQLAEIKAHMDSTDTPDDLFPAEVLLGYNHETMEDKVVTINTANVFRGVMLAVMAHVVAKRKEMRQLKQELDTLTLAELQSWVDPRI
jgi:hypothetical protein